MAHPAKSPTFYTIGIERVKAFLVTLDAADERRPDYLAKLEHYETELRWYATGSRAVKTARSNGHDKLGDNQPAKDTHESLDWITEWLTVNGRFVRIHRHNTDDPESPFDFRVLTEAHEMIVQTDARIRCRRGKSSDDKNIYVYFPTRRARSYVFDWLRANGGQP